MDRTSRERGLVAVALLSLALGCGETSRDDAPRGDGGAKASGQAGSVAGGGRASSGGAVSNAGGGADSRPAGGSSSIAGSGVTQAGAAVGGADAGAGGSGDAGMGGEAGGTDEAPNKIVLFDGSRETFDNWYSRFGGMTAANPWALNSDGSMTVKGGSGDILSKTPFKNVFIHVEYWSPKYDFSATFERQLRANSGVYLQGSYEVAILDTFGLPLIKWGNCGAIYTIADPLVSACKMGGEWNAYDIEFRASVCTNGKKTTDAEFVEVKLNGVLIHQNVAASHETQAGLTETCEPRGVLLQDHTTFTPVSFRNIWAIPRD